MITKNDFNVVKTNIVKMRNYIAELPLIEQSGWFGNGSVMVKTTIDELNEKKLFPVKFQYSTRRKVEPEKFKTTIDVCSNSELLSDVKWKAIYDELYIREVYARDRQYRPIGEPTVEKEHDKYIVQMNNGECYNLIYIQYLLAFINDSAIIKYNKEKRNINFYTQNGKRHFGIIMPINYFDMEKLERVLIEENNALF